MNRVKEKYQKEIIPAMKAKFGYRNDLAVPKVVKVTINSGIGKYRGDQKAFEEIEKGLGALAGQKAVYTLAKKAISTFKTRIGQPIGLKVTLRGERMYDFMDRLVSLTLPRVRDFRGLEKKSVDDRGNMNIGIKEQIVFPEISHENIKTIFGVQATFTTNAKNHEEGLELFRLLGFPIKK